VEVNLKGKVAGNVKEKGKIVRKDERMVKN
jgi:hypothetical protein